MLPGWEVITAQGIVDFSLCALSFVAHTSGVSKYGACTSADCCQGNQV